MKYQIGDSFIVRTPSLSTSTIEIEVGVGIITEYNVATECYFVLTRLKNGLMS